MLKYRAFWGAALHLVGRVAISVTQHHLSGRGGYCSWFGTICSMYNARLISLEGNEGDGGGAGNTTLTGQDHLGPGASKSGTNHVPASISLSKTKISVTSGSLATGQAVIPVNCLMEENGVMVICAVQQV